MDNVAFVMFSGEGPKSCSHCTFKISFEGHNTPFHGHHTPDHFNVHHMLLCNPMQDCSIILSSFPYHIDVHGLFLFVTSDSVTCLCPLLFEIFLSAMSFGFRGWLIQPSEKWWYGAYWPRLAHELIQSWFQIYQQRGSKHITTSLASQMARGSPKLRPNSARWSRSGTQKFFLSVSPRWRPPFLLKQRLVNGPDGSFEKHRRWRRCLPFGGIAMSLTGILS